MMDEHSYSNSIVYSVHSWCWTVYLKKKKEKEHRSRMRLMRRAASGKLWEEGRLGVVGFVRAASVWS